MNNWISLPKNYWQCRKWLTVFLHCIYWERSCWCWAYNICCVGQMYGWALPTALYCIWSHSLPAVFRMLWQCWMVWATGFHLEETPTLLLTFFTNGLGSISLRCCFPARKWESVQFMCCWSTNDATQWPSSHQHYFRVPWLWYCFSFLSLIHPIFVTAGYQW